MIQAWQLMNVIFAEIMRNFNVAITKVIATDIHVRNVQILTLKTKLENFEK